MPILHIEVGPQPNAQQIAHVWRYYQQRPANWARTYMDRTGGFDAYPLDLRQAVERTESAAQHKAPMSTIGARRRTADLR